MLKVFWEQRKPLLALQLERQQQEAGILPKPAKRPRLANSALPSINADDFRLIRNICLILEIFDIETKKV